MDIDSIVVKYMKEKAEYSKLVACATAVHCFVLAVFFCTYELISNYFMYSEKLDLARNILICISVVVALLLAVFNWMICCRYTKVIELTPDYIAIRQSIDVIREAYNIACAHLNYQITIAVFLSVCGGFIYIFLQIVMDRSDTARVFGWSGVMICLAVAMFIGIPAIDRKISYKLLLSKMHSSMKDRYSAVVVMKAIAVGIPLSVCGWYIVKFFTSYSQIAFIVFPMAALFGAAFVYLIGYYNDTVIGK